MKMAKVFALAQPVKPVVNNLPPGKLYRQPLTVLHYSPNDPNLVYVLYPDGTSGYIEESKLQAF